MFIPREERAARNANCLNSSACFSEFRLPPGAAATQWILFSQSWARQKSLNWLVAFLYWNFSTIGDDCDVHWQSFGSTWNPNLISPSQRAALKLNCVRLTTEGAREMKPRVAMSVCAVWWFDYAWDSGARLRLPSILSCGLRNRICFARKFFHQKFKVTLGHAWIEIFLVQHLHNFWTTSKAGIASGCTICEHRAGELIMETLFHPLQQFHNEFRMNEPRRHWSGAEYEHFSSF